MFVMQPCDYQIAMIRRKSQKYKLVAQMELQQQPHVLDMQYIDFQNSNNSTNIAKKFDLVTQGI